MTKKLIDKYIPNSGAKVIKRMLFASSKIVRFTYLIIKLHQPTSSANNSMACCVLVVVPSHPKDSFVTI